MAKKSYSLKAETLGGRNVSAQPSTAERPTIGKKYIRDYIEMHSKRQEDQGKSRWPVSVREEMRQACAGMTNKSDMKVVIAKIAGLKPEDL